MSKAAVAKIRDRKLTLRELLDDLVGDGLITAQQATSLRGKSAAASQHPLITVAEIGWHDARQPGQKLTAEFLVQWLAERAGLPYCRIDPLTIDVPRITSVISYPYASRAGILVVRVSSTEVTVATAEPYDLGWEKEIAPIVNLPIQRVLANPADIHRYQVEFYALARSVKASQQEQGQARPGVQNLEQLMQLGRAGKLDANDQHVVNIVDWLLQYAFEQRASDIHLEPRREVGNIRFRIDGVLHEVYQTPASVLAAVTSRLKILARMDLAEKRRPQDGRVKTRSPDGKEVELRVSSLPTAFGEKLVMRIFDPDVLLQDFSQLGLSKTDAARWESMVEAPHGIVLVTGPTGSGKTTTLYSTLRQLATSEVNVCTIEDPIELVEPAFNQMQVHPAIDLGFATGVRALLRQDPDIIMIGEIRDLETAEIAVQAALTGHLVLSTLHTNDAPSAVTRLLDLGVPPYLLRSTLLGVVAQRLVRKLCTSCKRPVQLTAERWREITGGWSLPAPGQVHEPQGCLECRATGYFGRIGLFEMMQLTRTLGTLVTQEAELSILRTAALDEGMTPLRIAGAQLVARGITSVDEVMRAAPAPPEARRRAR